MNFTLFYVNNNLYLHIVITVHYTSTDVNSFCRACCHEPAWWDICFFFKARHAEWLRQNSHRILLVKITLQNWYWVVSKP